MFKIYFIHPRREIEYLSKLDKNLRELMQNCGCMLQQEYKYKQNWLFCPIQIGDEMIYDQIIELAAQKYKRSYWCRKRGILHWTSVKITCQVEMAIRYTQILGATSSHTFCEGKTRCKYQLKLKIRSYKPAESATASTQY